MTDTISQFSGQNPSIWKSTRSESNAIAVLVDLNSYCEFHVDMLIWFTAFEMDSFPDGAENMIQIRFNCGIVHKIRLRINTLTL